MAISFVAATEAGTGSAQTSLSVNVPSGTTDDDVLLLFGVTADGDDGGFDALTGWTELVDAAVLNTGGSAPSPPGMSVWVRVASSEPASYTITPTAGSTGICAQMLAFRGDTPATIDVTTVTATGDGSNANPGSINQDNMAAVVVAAFWDSAGGEYSAVPSGYTSPDSLGVIVAEGGGNGGSLATAYNLAPSDPEDPPAFTSGSEQWGAVTVALLEVVTEGITSVTPSSFRLDESDIDVAGLNFEASAGSIYIATADTLAGGSEVDIGSAINTWANDNINLDLTALSSGELSSIRALGLGTLYIIVVNGSADEYASDALTVEEIAATAVGAAGADPELDVDTNYRWQARIENSGGEDQDDFKVQYYHTEGTATWTDVTGSSDVVQAVATSYFADGDDVPESLTGSGTYVSNNNAALETDGALTLAAALGADEAFELHLSFQIIGDDVDDDDTIQLRIVKGDGTALGTYTDTPTITVNKSTGDMVASGAFTVGGNAGLAAFGAVDADGSLFVAGAADLRSIGQVVADGSVSIFGASSLTALGVLAADGSFSVAGAGDLSGIGNIDSDGSVSVVGSAQLIAIGRVIAAGSLSISGSADMPAPSDVEADGALAIGGDATLNALGEMLSDGAITLAGNAALDAWGNVEADGALTISGDAALAAIGALAASGSVSVSGNAVVTAIGSLSADGALTVTGDASLSSIVQDLAASGVLAISGTSTISAFGAVTAAGVIVIAGDADLAGISESLTASGSIAIDGTAQASASGAMSADGAIAVLGAAILGAVGSIDADGSFSVGGDAALDSVGTLSAGGAVSVSGQAVLDALGALVAAGQLSIAGSASIVDANEIPLSVRRSRVYRVEPGSRLEAIAGKNKQFVVVESERLDRAEKVNRSVRVSAPKRTIH